jgi:phosphoglycerate kinase
MAQLKDVSLKGKKVLVRVDFNVPLNDNFEITDDNRIRAALPTIQKVLGDGGKLILMSHLGRPKNGPEHKFSLVHLQEHLSKLTNAKVLFVDDCIGPRVTESLQGLNNGEILLLENVRFYIEETKGDESFAKALSELGDVYINDAFGTAHRAHASTTIVAKYFNSDARFFGFLMDKEVQNARRVIEGSQKPFTAIIGGAKVSDKIEIIENLLSSADNIIIGGGMAYTFFKAQGGNIGNSLVEEEKLDLANEIIHRANIKGVKILLPTDSVIADQFSNEANVSQSDNMNIKEGWMGLDIGPEAIALFSEVISSSKTVLWNGPMGVFEMSKFELGTKRVAEALAKATLNGAFTLIGGGDSAAAIKKFDLLDDVSYVSTGGGALLEFFEGKVLPGIAAIEH